MSQRRRFRGFTVIELLIVVSIIAIAIVGSMPAVLNMMETRELEGSIRDIQTTFQQAKLLSVKEKVNTRILFNVSNGVWSYRMLRQNAAGTWDIVASVASKTINRNFTVTVNLPQGASATQRIIDFSPIGMVDNYNAANNAVTVFSQNLSTKKSPYPTRTLTVYFGGSFEYGKS